MQRICQLKTLILQLSRGGGEKSVLGESELAACSPTVPGPAGQRGFEIPRRICGKSPEVRELKLWPLFLFARAIKTCVFPDNWVAKSGKGRVREREKNPRWWVHFSGCSNFVLKSCSKRRITRSLPSRQTQIVTKSLLLKNKEKKREMKLLFSGLENETSLSR